MRKRVVKDFDKYSVNPNVFINVSTKEAAYVLGFLWADGYILLDDRRARIAINLQLDDFQIVVPTFQKTGRWPTRHYHYGNRKPQGTAEISNYPLCLYLIEHGYETKSEKSACKIISKIPETLQKYWFRGLFDGDGGLYLNPDGQHVKLNIASSLNQDWTYIIKLLKKMNIYEYRIHRTIRPNGNKHSKIEMTKRSKIIELCDFIYDGFENDQIGLSRKYNKLLEIKKLDKILFAKRLNKNPIQRTFKNTKIDIMHNYFSA